MKQSSAFAATTAGLLLALAGPSAQSVELDDLDITIQVIESDQLDTISHELRLPELSHREHGTNTGPSGNGGKRAGTEHRSRANMMRERDSDGRDKTDDHEGERMAQSPRERAQEFERGPERMEEDDHRFSSMPGGMNEERTVPKERDGMNDFRGEIQEHAREINDDMQEQNASFREEYEDSEKAEREERLDHRHQRREQATNGMEAASEARDDGDGMREAAGNAPDRADGPMADFHAADHPQDERPDNDSHTNAPGHPGHD